MTQPLTAISAAADGTVLGLAAGGAIVQAVTGPSWNTIAPTGIDGPLTSIGAGSDKTIWGISGPGSVWAYATDGTGWTSITCPYPVTQIAVGSATNIWAADGKGAVYQYAAASSFTSRGNDITSVAVASDGSVWGLNGAGMPQQYDPSTTSWSSAPAPVEAFVSLSVGAAGWIVAIGKSGKAYQYDAGNSNTPWLPIPTQLVGATFASVACGDDATIWAVDSQGNAYVYTLESQDWTPAPGQNAHAVNRVAVGDADVIWAISTTGTTGTIYQILSNSLTWVPIVDTSPLTSLSVGAANNIWGLDSSGNVHQSTGGLTNWNLQPIAGGPLKVVSAGADGSVWGIAPSSSENPAGVVRYTSGAGWAPVACPYMVADISVGSAKYIVASDGLRSVYTYEGESGWSALPGTATGVAVASDGTMWGIDLSGKACIYFGGHVDWYSTPTAVRQVTVGSFTNVWAIDANGNAIQLIANAAMISELAVDRRRASLTGWDTESVWDETQSTHLWIVNRAVALLGNQKGMIGILTLFPPFEEKLGTNGADRGFHDNVCQGLYDADFLSPYNGPTQYRYPTWASHFYDPSTGLNWQGSKSWTALVEGTRLFWEALDHFVDGDMPKAGYHLGLSLHYLTDMTQPMHAANFTYYSSSSIGYHTAFESYAMEVQGGVKVTIPTTLPDSGFGTDPGQYFISAATNAKSRYFAQITPSDIAQNYNWSSGLTDQQRAQLLPSFAPILSDAIVATAQYLRAWMTLTAQVSSYVLVSSLSGYVIDIPDWSNDSGSPIDQWQWNNGTNQQFNLVPLSGPDAGYWQIRATCSHLVLDVAGQSVEANAQIVQTSASGADSQKWKQVKVDGTTVSFQNKNSGLLLTAVPPFQKNGSPLVQGPPDTSGAQRWQLTPNAPVQVQFGGALGYNLDVQGGVPDGGTILDIWPANTSSAQRFLLVPLGGKDAGYYLILTQAGGLAVEGASGKVMQEQWDSSDAQKWQLQPSPSNKNYVFFKNKASGQYMNVPQQPNGGYQQGTALTTTADPISLWTLAPVTSQ